MSGITFLNPGFWPWTLAISVPILVHLLTRRTRRVQVLPTFAFLQRSLAQQTQVFRLRHWLLLALRMLLLLFLVLTFLKPTLTAPLANLEGTRQSVVVVLDTSLSMGAEHGGVSSLTRARGQVMTLLDDLRPGDQANVILAGSAPRAILPKLSGDFGTLRQAVKSAQVTAERGEMPAAIAAAAEMLASSEAPRKELLLASDFQRANWADVPFDSLSPDVRLVFLNSDAEPRENTALIGLHLRPATPRAGEEASLVAEVWNGTRAARSLVVSITIKGEMGKWGNGEMEKPLVNEGNISSFPHFPISSSVTIPPFASGTVTVPITFPDAGRYKITARIPADGLPADDTRALAADLGHSLTVLLLTDAELRGSSGAYFLSRALNPTPDQPGGIRVIAKRATEISETDLRTCDAVFLEEVETLPADRLPLLARYLSNGGAMVVFLSGPRSIGQMQALAKQAPNGDGLPLLPQMQMDVRRQGKGYVTLTEARYDSPLLKLFKDPGAGDLGKVRFRRFFLIREPDPRTEVLLKFEDGTPAAARRNFGAGSLLICNFSPAPATSDLARQEVFPPLAHEFLKGMTAKEGDKRDFTPGGPASTTLDVAQAQGEIRALGPTGVAERVLVDRTGGGVILERVETPGFHTILANGQEAAVLAVNPHPDESDLRALDPRELQSRQARRASTLVSAGGSGSAAALEDLRRGRPLWPYCLLAALAALLLEQAVTTFGGQARLRRTDAQAAPRGSSRP